MNGGIFHGAPVRRDIKGPSDVLKVGQKVKVKVLNIDPSERRISLSMKAVNAKGSTNGNYRSRRGRNENSVNKKYMGNEDNGFALGDIIGDQLKDRK